MTETNKPNDVISMSNRFTGEISNSAVINVIHVVSELLQDEEYIL